MQIKDRIQNKESTIGIIGLGYVGLPLAIRFGEESLKVIGFDIDEHKVNMLNEGKSYIKHINEGNISGMVKQGFIATTDFAKITDVDAILICVPTPLGVHNEPDLSYVKSTLDLVKSHLREEQLLILESTTYPGTTAEEIVPVIEALGFKVGENFYIGYSPEREDPGNKNFSTQTIPKVVSGHTKNCLEVTTALYDQIVDQTVPVSSTQVAEMTKILENIHRAVNIGLVNELKMVADKMNIDINEVIKAAATKPFGFTAYYPGPGLGGHCIPIDPFYLTWKAKEVGMNTRFIELAGEINTSMPNYVIQKVSESLNSIGKSIKNSRILILGLAYKKNVDDLRESPSLELIDILIDKGALVDYCDPYFKSIPNTRKYQIELKSKVLNADVLQSMDLVLLATDHDDFDYDLIEKESSLIIDTRGRFEKSEKVIKA
ncbi:MAG: nucleotide sugar dehydrogenase [Candidatus Marinimicrobia bacterium]|jgi:UDP-N-acetyl-D-glucosamine dehydrogenase|nr:nucleotide sugar dehydrogenase [Candidatus Neomarinimicrobiota bacterium]MBT7184455.1 nucleotide sugar dehydrogenase [Candidatus Neomarinimicrobiota bacterium]MBT7357594.1 nucleotide sugar dehydrogenase [Candidatus Neomarinimicrobiota bacterium]MBT7513064.1 nucleotide sugar dehydrogenase [Candidatus Neomarinimicrobiota bacterium]